MEFLKLRRQQQLERELNGYVDWICTAGRQRREGGGKMSIWLVEKYLIKWKFS